MVEVGVVAVTVAEVADVEVTVNEGDEPRVEEIGEAAEKKRRWEDR